MADPSPNRNLVGVPGSRALLSTPALVLDLGRFEANLTTMMRLTREAGLALRPHGKSHKCSRMARLQIEAGAVGICCANLREAEVMARAGLPGVVLTTPIADPRKIDRLVAAAAADLMVVSDDPGNVRALAAAARNAGKVLKVLVDIEIGHGRTGVASPDDAVALARVIVETDGVEYAGVQGYSGRVQHISGYAERAGVYGAQLDYLATCVQALEDAGMKPEIVTGGGTGTLFIDRDKRVVTEHQGGSYALMDVEYGQVELTPGGERPFETALTLAATVISANRDQVLIIDAGSKAIATDGPPAEAPSLKGAAYGWFGDDHGRLVVERSPTRPGLGARVELVTSHVDPTVNLHDHIHVVRGDTLVDIWDIDARGSL